MKNERKIFYGIVVGIIVFITIGWIFFGSGTNENNFKYLSHQQELIIMLEK